MTTVSVVVPVYNHAGFVGEALQSALQQTVPPHEVVVVDDGSTDDTPAVLARYRGRVRVMRQRNAGVSAARNAGAAAAAGDLIAFLDADDAWLPTKLERQLERFSATPGLGLVHCGVAEVDGKGTLLQSRLDGMEGRVAEKMLFFGRGVILAAGSTALIPREVFEQIGGFDVRLSTSADWDLCFRAARQHPVGFVPEILVRYRMHGANMHGNVRVMERDMLLAYSKVFGENDPELRRLRRRAYGSLHTALAGSFFRAGDYAAFARHAVRSLMFAPEETRHYLGYPTRALRRATGAGR